MRTKPSLTMSDVNLMVSSAVQKATSEGWAVSIAIVDDGGNLLHFIRMDDAKPGSIWTAIEKARSAVLFGRPTKALEDIIAGGRNAMLSLPNSVPIQGGIPITHETVIVGGIGVSGVTSPQDEDVAVAGLSALP